MAMLLTRGTMPRTGQACHERRLGFARPPAIWDKSERMAGEDVTTLDAGELDALVSLLAAEQVRLDRNIPFLGDDAAGIRAELGALEPPWTSTARVLRDADGTIAGVSMVERDESIGRAWIYGPWIFGDDDAWTDRAADLLDAALAQLPAGADVELLGEVANVRLAALAAQFDFTASGVSHVLTIDAEGVSKLPADANRPLREAVADDLAAIRPVHDAEFPNTHTPAARVISELVTVVAMTDDGTVTGYAAGKVQPDGEGYIDYVGVETTARGQGIGRDLVSALTRELFAASPKQQVALVVDDDRVAARALYASLGFERITSMVGYRRVR
jgi:ribosomal protein S18 acetylase RimI-like enzyme